MLKDKTLTTEINVMIKKCQLLLILLLPFLMAAQDGTLDLSFGDNGKVVGDFPETTRFESVAVGWEWI